MKRRWLAVVVAGCTLIGPGSARAESIWDSTDPLSLLWKGIEAFDERRFDEALKWLDQASRAVDLAEAMSEGAGDDAEQDMLTEVGRQAERYLGAIYVGHGEAYLGSSPEGWTADPVIWDRTSAVLPLFGLSTAVEITKAYRQPGTGQQLMSSLVINSIYHAGIVGNDEAAPYSFGGYEGRLMRSPEGGIAIALDLWSDAHATGMLVVESDAGREVVESYLPTIRLADLVGFFEGHAHQPGMLEEFAAMLPHS